MAKITLHPKDLFKRVTMSFIIFGPYCFLHSFPPIYFLYIAWNLTVFTLKGLEGLALMHTNFRRSDNQYNHSDIYNCIRNMIISLSYLTVGVILVAGSPPAACAYAIGVLALLDAFYLKSEPEQKVNFEAFRDSLAIS